MNQESRTEPAPDQPPESEFSAPRRFLGDRPDRQALTRGRASSRLFATASALVFLLIVLATILLSFRNQIGDRILLTAAVPVYESPLVRPLDFAEQDLGLLRSAGGVELGLSADGPPVGNLSTEEDLYRLVNEILPVVDHDSLILFVRMHAVSTPSGTFLLPADGDPLRPQEGLPLRRFLDAVIDSPATNKLVLMDVAQVDYDPNVGWFGNDVRRHIERALHSRPDEGGNLCLICSADDGQTSWSSVTVQQSVFGAVASYCLHGGVDADGLGESGRRDGLLFASEVATCLEQNVADWSLRHRSALQKPFRLQIGDDFPIAGVNALLTIPSFFTEREPLARAGVERNEQRRAEQSSEEATANGDQSTAEQPLPTTESVLGRLLAAWQRRGELEATTAPERRPRHWALFSQELQRAERLLLAGRIDDADQVMTVSIEPLETDLSTAPVDLIRSTWSVALVDPTNEDDGLKGLTEAVSAAESAPTLRNLDRLKGSPFIEAALLRRLSQRMVQGETDEDAAWADPQLLQAALAAQSLAERAGRLSCPPAEGAAPLSEPCLWPVLKGEIEAADQLRLTAEHEGLLGRFQLATTDFEPASSSYESVLEQCPGIAGQMKRLHLTLLESASMIAWLSRAHRDEAWWIETVRMFDAFIKASVDFRQRPRIEQLPPLIALSDELHRRADSAAREAVQSGDPVELRSALELPFLDSALRSEILSAVIDSPEAFDDAGGLNRFAETEAKQVAYPFAIATLDRALAVPAPPAQTLEQTDPASREFIRRSALQLDDSLRERRVALGDAFRLMLADLNADPLALPPQGASSYEQYVSHLMRAPFQSHLLTFTRFQPLVTDKLYGRMTNDLLSWQLLRLERAAATTGIDVSLSLAAITRNIREIDADYQVPARPQPAFAATHVALRRLPSSGRIALTFDVAALQDLKGMVPLLREQWTRQNVPPRFVVDWFSERDRWAVLSVHNHESSRSPRQGDDRDGGRTDDADSWRLAVPVPGLVNGSPVSIEMDLQRLGSDENAQATSRSELTGWIESPNGARYWLRIPFDLNSDVLPPFEIQLTGPGGAPLPDRVDLFPNQQFPIGIGVVSRFAEPHPVTIGIASAGEERLVDVTVNNGTEATLLAPGYSFQLPIEGAEIRFRVVQDSKSVSERTLTLNVLNPLSSFQPEVSYDADTHTVTAVVRRLVQSFSDQVVSAELGLVGVPAEGGNLQAELNPAQQRAELTAVVPSDAFAPYYDVTLGMCSVPRLFHYRVDAANGTVFRIRKSSVNIVSPVDGMTYSHTTDASISVPVNAAVDCDGTCLVNIGIDRNGDGYLDEGEQLDSEPCWAGRRVTTQLTATADPAGFVVGSRVSDVSVPIVPAGLVGAQTILAQLISGDRILTAASKVYFLQSAPPVVFDTPQADERIAFGDPFQVVLRSDDAAFRAVEKLEVGVDRNNNGAWDDDETLTSMMPAGGVPLRFGDSNRAADVFDSGQLLSRDDAKAAAAVPATNVAAAAGAILPRRVVLMARSTVHTLNLAQPDESPELKGSQIARRVIELISQADKPTPTGNISGYVITADGLPQRDVQINVGEVQTQSDDEGQFLLKNVPAGPQTIHAVRGLRGAEVDVEVAAGETTSGVEVVIVR